MAHWPKDEFFQGKLHETHFEITSISRVIHKSKGVGGSNPPKYE